MLESLADFWKPIKKNQPEEKFQSAQLQLGSSIGFGFVPQAILSGRRLTVSAINTYQFGDESLTSFILTQDKDPGVSMIVAESEGEQYLAISRRISTGDRMKLFNARDLDAIITSADVSRLTARENNADYKGWVVSAYKREIQGMKGRIFKGDFRTATLPPASEAQEFEYTLLVSDSNEYAIEIEKYGDGRIEVYATVYRRMNDVGEVTHPNKQAAVETPRPETKVVETKIVPMPEPVAAPAAAAPVVAQPIAPAAPVEPAKPAPYKFQELTPTAPVTQAPPVSKSVSEPQISKEAIESPAPEKTPVTTQTSINGTSKGMNTMESNMKPKLYVQPNPQETYKETKAVTNGAANFDSDAIACDLRVANKIIDEAIRSEIRLSDVVRKIAGLPVEDQGVVQIPVALSDEDYALLAIRYGISSSDRNAIKRRLVEDLNDFSGSNAAKKAA